MRRQVFPLGRRACLLLVAAGLFSCSLPQQPEPQAPTRSITQAYQTVSARLTQVAATAPAATTAPTANVPPPATPSNQPPPAASPTLPGGSATQTPPPTAAGPPCNQAAAGAPIDVTIPDDSEIAAGQSFTKTWRLRNVGSCTWNQTYRLELFSGDAMGAALSQPLPGLVPPGQQVDLSLDLTAPLAAGPARGDWKLRDPQGKWFGIGPSGGASFWVQIIVVPLPTPSPTFAPIIPILTTTPGVLAAATLSLIPGQRADLDLPGLVDTEAVDLGYDTAPDGKHYLIAIGASQMAIFGDTAPAYADCQAAQLTNLTLNVENLPPGAYLCYQTNQGLLGRLQFLELDAETWAVSVDVQTWSVP